MLSVVQNCTGKNWEENTAVLVQAPLFAGLYWCSLWAEASAGGSSLEPFIISSNLSSTCAQRSSYFLLFRKSEWVDTPTLHSKWTFQEYRMPLWKGSQGNTSGAETWPNSWIREMAAYFSHRTFRLLKLLEQPNIFHLKNNILSANE